MRWGGFETQAAVFIPGWETNRYASHLLSEDGRRAFFEAADALSSRDTNGVQDVYEWEEPGSGSCDEASPSYSPLNGGCITLVSSGKSARLSEFDDASPSGEDVFFSTLSSLVPQDYGLVDVYDARVNGGLPVPSLPRAECEGEACQGTPAPPSDPTPASAAFEGAGNVTNPAKKKKKKKKQQGRHKHRKHTKDGRAGR